MDLPTSWQMVEMSGNDLYQCGILPGSQCNADRYPLRQWHGKIMKPGVKRQAQVSQEQNWQGFGTWGKKNMEARETVREMLAQNVKPAHIMKAAWYKPPNVLPNQERVNKLIILARLKLTVLAVRL